MKNTHLRLLVLCLSLAGLSMFIYKVRYLHFPLSQDVESPVWNVETNVSFIGNWKSAKVTLHIPQNTNDTIISDENFISYGYGLATNIDEVGNRRAVWSIRKANGRQILYYRAVIRRNVSIDNGNTVKKRIPQVSPAEADFEGADLTAADSIIADVTGRSADIESFVLELFRQINGNNPGDNMSLLLGKKPTQEKKLAIAVKLLTHAKIASQIVHGVRLVEEIKRAPLISWLEVYHLDIKQWRPYDVLRLEAGIPEDYFGWWRGEAPLYVINGGKNPQVTISVTRNQEQAISSALASGRISSPLLLEFSLFSLPIEAQTLYRVLLTIPIGALILVILRNVIGLKTFGTFMPVLIALAFRETQLLGGIILFVLIVGLGLAVRFYLEKLKLLLVPRLVAVLTCVVLVMVGVSMLMHKLGIASGLSVALFPMVILTMTIERMCIVWEEQGALESLLQGLGSIVAATLSYLVMTIPELQHITFVFPELLLVILALTLMLGRYTGYRLTELRRFKSLVE